MFYKFDSNTKAVIFDLDGTLYDNSGVGRGLVMSWLPDALLAYAERTVRKSFKGKDFGNREGLLEAFGRAASLKTKMTTDDFLKWYDKVYMMRMIRVLEKKYTFYDKVPEVLKKLRAMGVKTAVYSDYPKVADRMEAIGISPSLVDIAISAEEFGVFKPAKTPMIELLRILGSEKEQTLVVGDRIDTDGQSAFISGCNFVQIYGKKSKKQMPKGEQATSITFEGKTFPLVTWDCFANSVLEV
ncbi:MAG: HAD family hydrolase [Treponemataceae bacterium]|nr:HAD family hydrolase [Treponemataceae bacterium]